MVVKNKKLGVLVVFLLTLVLFSYGVYATPSGASVTPSAPETWNGGSVGSVAAYGGNITQIDLDSQTQTQVWQGYYGEVSGNMTLNDASGNTMYDWSLLGLSGEVYASRVNNVAWGSVVAQNTCTTDEGLTGTGSDRVNRTFTASSNTAFSVGATAIGVNTACSTYTYVNNASQSASFEEILLDDGANSIYATFIDADTTGFDGSTHDFQLIVPVSSGSTTTYYFYVELE